jgi:hypothetical protein
MLFFRSEENLDRWCAAQGVSRGATLTVEQTWELSKDWYGPRLAPDYRGRSLAEIEAIFRRHELTSPFWSASTPSAEP